jgi:peptidyl-dipeptidase Dcp
MTPSSPSPPGATANPLLAEWTGSYGGVPAFDRVEVEHFRPALQAAMATTVAAVEKIATAPEPATFDNTIAALERATRSFHRLHWIFNVWSGGLNTEAFQAIERDMAPKLAAYRDEIHQNAALFARIEAVYQQGQQAGLSAEQQRLAWKVHNDFLRSGARLAAPAKQRLRAINQQLAGLFTRFSQNVLADENERFLVIEDEGSLVGLPQSLRDAARATAESKEMASQWVIANTRSSVELFLTTSQRRDLRERVWRTFVDRGDHAGKRDNKPLVTQILRLRAERAKLLGYPTHAHYRLDDTMAKTPQRALELLEAVWAPAVVRVGEEVADMQAIAEAGQPGIRIEPWDYRFYAEKVRKQKYELDDKLIKPYLQLAKLREGMFWVAGELFGIAFRPVTDVPVFHPDVRVWEVIDKATQKHRGLWYFDPYARPNKQSGAWMSAYRVQERFEADITPLVSNNSNFIPAKPGEPVLLSWDDAATLFHEFGHALHGLMSDVSYPSLAGTAVCRDYVELPSQLLEHWLSTPEVLHRFAVHYQTGEPMPKKLVERIQRAATFNQGFAMVEYLSGSLVDMKLHLAGDEAIDPAEFERTTLAALNMPRQIVMRHRTPQFLHIFAGDGYSAGYYSYLWADVLTADGFEVFREAGGPYDSEVAARLRKHVFSVGNTVDPAVGYRRFRGRDATIDALLRKRGFAADSKAE